MKPSAALRYELALTPQASATTARTASIDVSNCSYVSVIVPVTIEANTNSTNVILDVLGSDDTVVTNHVSLGTVLLDNAAAIVGVYNVDRVKANKRYLRVTVTPDTTTNGAVLVGGIMVAKTVAIAPNASTTSSVTSV